MDEDLRREKVNVDLRLCTLGRIPPEYHLVPNGTLGTRWKRFVEISGGGVDEDLRGEKVTPPRFRLLRWK